MQRSLSVFLYLCLAGLLAAGTLSFKIDLEQIKQTSAQVNAAAQEGDSQTVLLNGRRLLELIPNEPSLQAPIYLLLSQAAKNLGESKRAEDYAHIARILDPGLESRMKKASGATRADYSPTIQTTAGAVMQVISQVEQIRMMKMCLEMVKHNMTPPPACGTANGAAGVPQAGMMPPGQPQSFPPQPVMAPQAPMAPQPPMAPQAPLPPQPPMAPQAPLPPMPPQPAMAPQAPMTPQAPMPSQPTQPAPIPYPSSPVGTQNYQPQSSAPAAMPGWGAQQQAMGRSPYGGSQYRPPQTARRRAGEEPVFRVAHDHSRISDTSYFDAFCNALLSVSETNLTFTSSGTEGALVIPAGDVVEIRVNALLGKDAGLFHIITRQGLYLSLAPESQDRDQTRALIETLRTRLGLGE